MFLCHLSLVLSVYIKYTKNKIFPYLYYLWIGMKQNEIPEWNQLYVFRRLTPSLYS